MEDGSFHRFRRYVRPRNAGTACGRIQALRRSPQRLPRRVRSGKPPDRRSRGQYTGPGRRFSCPKRAPALSGSGHPHPRGPPARPHRPRSGRDPRPPVDLTSRAGPPGRIRPPPATRPRGASRNGHRGIWTRFDRKSSTAETCRRPWPEHRPECRSSRRRRDCVLGGVFRPDHAAATGCM